MDELAAILAKHDIFIISDEIYSENSFEGEHRSFAQYPELKDKLFLIHGLSKSHSMTGWRIGFLLAAEKWMQQAVKVHAYNTICASVPSQHAAICALTECQHTPAAMNPDYILRRDYVYTRLTNMGLPTVKPTGAFYIFPSIKEFNHNSRTIRPHFARRSPNRRRPRHRLHTIRRRPHPNFLRLRIRPTRNRHGPTRKLDHQLAQQRTPPSPRPTVTVIKNSTFLEIYRIKA